MIRKNGLPGFLARAAVSAAAALGLGAAGRVSPGPDWWEISLRVEVQGAYVVRTEGRTYSGDFAGRALWTGVLERDREDFRLFRTEAAAPEWRLRETETRRGRVLAERDAETRPEPIFNYILRQGSEILLDFRLEGPDIPLPPAKAALRLPLPRSAETARQLGEPDYNLEVREGSNAIVLSDADIGGSPSVKSFRWTWESRRWGFGRTGSPSFTGRHTAEVVVAVTPRRKSG